MVMAVGAAIEVGGVLWKIFQRTKEAQMSLPTLPTAAAAEEQAITTTLDTIHEAQDVALVTVKS